MNKIADSPAVELQAAGQALPRVSIVIVCYNQARYLPDAIRSALAQTSGEIEVLIVDDGSTDNTRDVALSFPQVRYVHQNNRGLAAARNTGIRETTGAYLLFLDADDRLLPEAVQSSLECFQEQPESGFVFGAFRIIYDDGSTAPAETISGADHDYYWHLLQGNIIGMHGTVLYSRRALLDVSGFDERLPACEDYDLYLRISRLWPVRRHERLIAEYRQHDSNMSRDYAFMLKSVLAVLRMERGRAPGDRRHRAALRTGARVWRQYYGELLIERWKEQADFRQLLPVLRRYPRGVMARAFGLLTRRMLVTRRMLGGLRVRAAALPGFRRLEPLSRQFGLDRGQPIDRYYIESFLAQHSEKVRGSVLEIGDDSYSRRFGGANILHQDILHVVPGHPGATIIADLANAPHIRNENFDCIILTQTLHYIFDVDAAIATLERILKPGGALLLTVPGISQICRDQADPEGDCWRFTGSSLRRILIRRFPGSDLSVRTYGNVLAAASFLYGRAAHELTQRELDHHDADYPLTIAAAVVKRNDRI
jgi:glycosyltransferase involved in cell wall biosynthesis